jgi:hypothetical protein
MGVYVTSQNAPAAAAVKGKVSLYKRHLSENVRAAGRLGNSTIRPEASDIGGRDRRRGKILLTHAIISSFCSEYDEQK